MGNPNLIIRRARCAAAVLVAGVLGGVGAASATETVSSKLLAPLRAEGLSLVGRGRLSWLGVRIYDASLWTSDGRWSGFQPGRPVALALEYARGFTREELIRITTGELARLRLADERARAAWSGALARMWPDVRAGDVMTAVVVPGGATEFYGAHGPLGRIDDPDFGPAYLSIWLDPRSAVHDLRAQLVGEGARGGRATESRGGPNSP